jgi:cyclopropane fatty-acyl-phospholipid synthase-like methyltransferase
MKPFSESCERNKEPILVVLREHFARAKRVLEIGSGTGQHAVYFAAQLPQLLWHTSDLPANHEGIRLWVEEAALANVLPPRELDMLERETWPQDEFDAIFTANTFHIMSWPAVRQAFDFIGARLAPGGMLAVYGPFNYGGDYTSESNRNFDAWLKNRNPLSGIRDFEAVDALAQAQGLRLVEDIGMPANNRTLVWARSAAS